VFAQSLSKLVLDNLTYLQLQFGYWEPHNHGWKPHSALHSSDPKIDHFSLSLHKLTQAPNLRCFYFHRYISLSPIFFWPQSDNDLNYFKENSHSKNTPDECLWPSLREFFINLSIVSPDGSWLFEAPPEGAEEEDPGTPYYSEPDDCASSDDSNTPESVSNRFEEYMTGVEPGWFFRSQVQPEKFALWVKSMARATKCMPKLQAGTLCMTPENQVFESFVEVQCRVTGKAETDREWEIQLGEDVGEPADEELIMALEESAERRSCVQVHHPDYPSLSDEYIYILS
jgi:hypothetical protein